MDVILVFVSAFLAFLASYAVARLVSWEAERKKARTSMRWIRDEVEKNRSLLDAAIQKPTTHLNHILFYSHHWTSAMQSGDLKIIRNRDAIADIASAYRAMMDIEKWMMLLTESYFSSASEAGSTTVEAELGRLIDFIRQRQQRALSRLDALLANHGVWNT